MSDLIVLGIIPGTNIHIGLLGWLVICLGGATVRYIAQRIRRVRTMRFLLAQLSLLLATRRLQLKRA